MMDGPGHSLYFSVWIGEACGVIESSGIAQRWDLGGRREGPAGGLGVRQLNDWGPLHRVEVQEDEQDKEEDELRVGHGEGNGYSLQYSCLENPHVRGAWWATVCRIVSSWT